MDKVGLEALSQGGAKIKIHAKSEATVIGDALQDQGAMIAKALERVGEISIPAPEVNVSVPEPVVTVEQPNITVMPHKKQRLKKVDFNVTGRDEMGNLTSFEAIPEYEDG